MEHSLNRKVTFNDRDCDMDMDSDSLSIPLSAASSNSHAFDATSHTTSLEGSCNSPATPPCVPEKAVCVISYNQYSPNPNTIVNDKSEILEPGVEEYVNRIKAHCRTLLPPLYRQHQTTQQRSCEDLTSRKNQHQDHRGQDQTLKLASYPSPSTLVNCSSESTQGLRLETQLKKKVSEGVRRFEASYFDDVVNFFAKNDDVPDFCMFDHLRDHFTFYGADQPNTNQDNPSKNSDFLAQNLPPLGSDFDYAHYLYGGNDRGSLVNGEGNLHEKPVSQLEFERRLGKATFIRDKASSAGYAQRNGEVPHYIANQEIGSTLLRPRGGGSSAQKPAEEYRQAREQGRKDYDKLFRQNLGIGSINNRPNRRSLYDGPLTDWETLWGSDFTGGFNADDRENEDDFEGDFGDSDEEQDCDDTTSQNDAKNWLG